MRRSGFGIQGFAWESARWFVPYAPLEIPNRRLTWVLSEPAQEVDIRLNQDLAAAYQVPSFWVEI